MNALEIFMCLPEDASSEKLASYLDELCGVNADLRAEVEALIAKDREENTFMGKPALEDDGTQSTNEGVGTVIGNYKLLQVIGEGGFGTVYMAEQLAPVKRRVALKIIKLGMDTKQVVARFEVERQALAMMDHPNIAKVHDAGATETGRPYFVMELVRGIPITKFCEEQKLDTSERLSLFIDVCSAIQHAHQKGIIHRDLKPSNVIVTLHDDKSVPKVIDFGVAKATQQDLTDKTLFTQFEQFIGTPAYMSPEQAQMSGLDIDTRSDIYALGVLLYELLTGTTPFDAKTLAKAGQDEIRRVIREEDPPKPSTRLTEAHKRTLSHSESHASDSKIDQDLDWIVMKALEKDRTRRYETANGLAADVQRHLNHEPVTAGAPSTVYRLKKLARKHRRILGIAAAMTTILILATGVSTWLAIDASEARRDSDNARILADTQKKAAEKSSQDAQDSDRDAQLRFAEEQLAAGKSGLGIAKLAQLLRDDLTNRIAAERLMSAVQRRELPKLKQVYESGSSEFAEFSPDGDHVLTAGRDQAQVWHTLSGTELSSISPPKGSIVNAANFGDNGNEVVLRYSNFATMSGIAKRWNWKTNTPIGDALQQLDASRGDRYQIISPDGNFIVAGNREETWSWDTVSNRKVTFPHGSFVGAFSPDGKMVVTCSRMISLWNPRTAELLHQWQGHHELIWSVAFSADATRLITASEDRTTRVWDVATGAQIGDPIVTGDRPLHVELSPGGQLIVTASKDGKAHFWNANTGREFGEPLKMADVLWSAQFNREGSQVVTTSRSGRTQLWDVMTRQPLGESMGRTWLRGQVCFSPANAWILTGDFINNALLWRADLAQPQTQTFRHRQAFGFSAAADTNVLSVAFSPDGQSLLTTGQDNHARVWDLAKGQEALTLNHSRRGQYGTPDAGYSGDGSLIFTASYGDGLWIWDAKSGEVLHQFADRLHIRFAEFCPVPDERGHYLIAAEMPQHGFQIWNASTGETLHGGLLDSGHRPSITQTGMLSAMRLAFSPDGKLLATGYADGTAQIWEVSTGKVMVTMSEHSDDVRVARFSPDGRRLITASTDGTARLWDVASGNLLGSPLTHSKQVIVAKFSPKGDRVVTGSLDGSARIWDAFTGEPKGHPMLHANWIICANYSPDGSRLATSAADGTARIWDAETGHPLSEPFRHKGFVSDAEFSPDGSRLATSGFDLTARLWEVPPVPEQPVPDWVPKWAESIVGLKLDEHRNPTEVPFKDRLAMEKKVLALPNDDFYTRIATWFHQSPRNRPISPFSHITFQDYVQNRLHEDTIASLEEALRVDPNNHQALSRIAELYKESRLGDPKENLFKAQLYARRALAQENSAGHKDL